MFDAPAPALQRTRGRASVVLGGGVATALKGLAQAGSAKAFLPRSHSPDPEVVFLNTAGGLTGGDRLTYALELGPGGRATATTQTAERAYRAAGDVAQMEVRLSAGAGAELHWLPQETILFDGAALHRRTEVALGHDARYLGVETVVLGRAAMGETLAHVEFDDLRTVRREGKPVFIEPLRIATDTLARTTPAALGTARAFATLVWTAPGVADALDPLRAVIAQHDCPAAASAWDGKLVLRAVAPDAFPLRRLLAAALTHIRGRALPRVWQI